MDILPCFAFKRLGLDRLRSFGTHRGTIGVRFSPLIFIAEMLEHKQPDGRGQVALFACPVNLCNQVRACRSVNLRDLLKVTPEGVFKADASPVPTNDDGTFDDR